MPLAAVALLVASVLAVMAYGILRSQRGWTFMEDPFGRRGWMYGWPLSHLLLFFALGLISPRHWFVFWLAGLAWELIELSASGLFPSRRDYWYSIRHDVVMNTLGLSLGATIGVLLRAAWRTRQRRRREPPSPSGRSRQLNHPAPAAAAAALVVVATCAAILLFGNDSWAYITDRSLTGQARERQQAFLRGCGVTERCQAAADAAKEAAAPQQTSR